MTRLVSQVAIRRDIPDFDREVENAKSVAVTKATEMGAVSRPAVLTIELEERTIVRVLGATKFNEHRAIQDGLARRYETETR